MLFVEVKSANFSAIDSFRTVLTEKMKKYARSEIYNCDETSLYYRTIGKKSFVSKGYRGQGIKVKRIE